VQATSLCRMTAEIKMAVICSCGPGPKASECRQDPLVMHRTAAVAGPGRRLVRDRRDVSAGGWT
jgi:hypothetical protein